MIIVQEKATLKQILETYKLSKSNIYKFQQGIYKAYCNGNLLTINDIVNVNDMIQIEKEANDIEAFSSVQELKRIKIIYEDDNIIAVSKPRGIIIHDDGNTAKTLLNLMSFYLKKTNQEAKLRVIHRIDKDTTGIVIFTKNIVAHSYLDYQMQNNQIIKRYIVMVDGEVKNDGTIDKPIGRDRHHSNRYLISSTGKAALTKYKVLKSGKTSLLDVEIKTGRTHQIRVHMKSINHPIVGDKIYNSASIGPLNLHAYLIKFKNPLNQKDIELTCRGDFYGN